MKVKIIGAGSIGNHLAHASRQMGWQVTVCDTDPEALKRMEKEIYPARYGVWDADIQLFESDQAPKGGFDLICIGTPPSAHIPLALEVLEESPGAIQIEKPLCPPDCEGMEDLASKAREKEVPVFIGYDHVVSEVSEVLAGKIRARELGELLYLDAEFREHWAGIFKAHHWLAGPADSYLGYWRRGGGAGGEHSHALNLWQHFASVVGASKTVEVQSRIDLVEESGVAYDRTFALQLKTEGGLQGRVIQDVITQPTRKVVIVTCEMGRWEWVVNHSAKGDALITYKPDCEPECIEYPKTRPDDFLREMMHIQACLKSGEESPISLQKGINTMKVLQQAYATVG